jgi:PST family polysaccharide transporter
MDKNPSSNIIHSKKKIAFNFILLALMQGSNFILPLLIFPYLVNVLGVERFGNVILAQTLNLYLIAFNDYSFGQTAVKEVAVHKEYRSELRNIFHKVMTAKLLLCAVSFVILLTLVGIVPMFRQEMNLFLLSFPMVLGQSLNPLWFFQGIEELKWVTVANVIAKVLLALLTFAFIRSEADYPLSNLFLGVGNLAAACYSLSWINRHFGLDIKIASLQKVVLLLREGWPIFMSNFAISIYILSNVLILGLFANSLEVGYYSVAEKASGTLRQLLALFSQVIYPRLCQLSHISHQHFRAFLQGIYPYFLGFIAICCSALFFFASPIIYFLTKETFQVSINLLKLLSFVPLIVALNIPAYQTLLAYGKSVSYGLILTLGSGLNIALNVFLASHYGSLGTAWSVILTELFVTIGLYVVIEYYHANISLFLPR